MSKTWYELGNCLRGYFSGLFETDQEAWDVLSKQFNESYPSRSGRQVELRKQIRVDTTVGGNETDRDRKIRLSLEAAIEREKLLS